MSGPFHGPTLGEVAANDAEIARLTAERDEAQRVGREAHNAHAKAHADLAAARAALEQIAKEDYHSTLKALARLREVFGEEQQ